MEPWQFREARQMLGLTLSDMGRLLGYAGGNVKSQVHKMETGARPVLDAQARLVRAYLAGYRPEDWPI